MSPKGTGGDWTRALREAAPLLGLGTSLAATVLVGLGVGHWLDQRFGTEPWLLITGAVLGLVAAGLHFIATVTRRRP